MRYPTLWNTEKMDDRMSRGPCDGLYYVPWNCVMVNDMVERMAKPHYIYPEGYEEPQENPRKVKTNGAIHGIIHGPLFNIVMHATTVLAKSMHYNDDVFCSVKNYTFNSCPEGSDREHDPVNLLYNAGNYSSSVLFLDLF